jgi:tetratricopeptide (TPR) repeat protein
MRTQIVLAIYVSLASGSFAEEPAALTGSTPEWISVYQMGLDASQRQRYEEAVVFYTRSWETSHTAEEKGDSASNLGQTFRRLGRMNEARKWMELAWHEWSADPRFGCRLTLAASNLADLYRTTGDYGHAERLLREELLSPGCGPESEGMLRNNLADLLREEGKSSEARPLFEASLEPGASSGQQYLGALIGLADIDRSNGDWEPGIRRWNEVLAICRRERDGRTEAIALRGLAMTWLGAGNAARAEPLLRRALKIMDDDPDSPAEQIASAHSGLGELYRLENKLALAEDEWSLALQIERAALGEAHPQVAWLLEMLSEVYSARGDFSLALNSATQASTIMSGSFGPNSMPVATALTNRALVEQRASDLKAAENDYERAIGIVHVHPEYRAIEAIIIQRYAVLLKSMHRTRDAKALLAQRDLKNARSFQLK